MACRHVQTKKRVKSDESRFMLCFKDQKQQLANTRWSCCLIGRQPVTWSGQVRWGRSDQTSGKGSQRGQSSVTACRRVVPPLLDGRRSGSDCSNPSGPSHDCTCVLPWQLWPSHPPHLGNGLVSDIILSSPVESVNQEYEALQEEV